MIDASEFYIRNIRIYRTQGKADSTLKLVTAGGGVWNAEVWEAVEGLSERIGIGVSVKDIDALL